MRRALSTLTVVVAAFAASACGGSQPVPQAPATTAAQPSTPVTTDKNAYPVFVDADAGADASVPAMNLRSFSPSEGTTGVGRGGRAPLAPPAARCSARR